MISDRYKLSDCRQSFGFQGSKLLRPFWFWTSVLFLIAAKLWLVSGQTLFVIGDASHDERLFLNIANHLISGEWLGPFNNLTLAKGVFYSFWLAGVHTLGIPLLLSQHLLYIAACILVILAIRPLVRGCAPLLLVFGILLFNPISYSSDVMSRVLREGIYPALTLMTIAFAAGFLIRYQFSIAVLMLWSLGFGVSLSAFWLTREEGIWLMPTLLVVMTFAVIRILQTRPVDHRKLLLCIFPFMIWGISVGTIAGMNKHYYGVFTTNELKSPVFLAAYGALSRVEHVRWRPIIPVPKETRERIYDASPAFAELKPFLEGDIGRGWGGSGLFQAVRDRFEKDQDFHRYVISYLERNKGDIWVKLWYEGELFHDEIFGGWFLWALRDAVAAAGYYSSGDRAAHYYKRLADEINTACNEGKLLCGSERSSLMPPWRRAYAAPLMYTFLRSAGFVVRFQDFSATSVPSVGTEDSFRLFYKLTRERLLPASVRLHGWVFSPDGPVNLSITGERGDTKNAKVIVNLPSEDVYQTFFSRGMNFPNARSARFDLKTYCVCGCTLHVRVREDLVKSIPIDGKIRSLETPRLYFHIDSREYQNASPHHAKIDALKITMLESIALPYQFAVPVLSFFGLIIYMIRTLQIFMKRTIPMLWIITTGILLAFIIRLSVISMVNVTSFPAINIQYFSASYPLLLIFIALNFVSLRSILYDRDI